MLTPAMTRVSGIHTAHTAAYLRTRDPRSNSCAGMCAVWWRDGDQQTDDNLRNRTRRRHAGHILSILSILSTPAPRSNMLSMDRAVCTRRRARLWDRPQTF